MAQGTRGQLDPALGRPEIIGPVLDNGEDAHAELAGGTCPCGRQDLCTGPGCVRGLLAELHKLNSEVHVSVANDGASRRPMFLYHRHVRSAKTRLADLVVKLQTRRAIHPCLPTEDSATLLGVRWLKYKQTIQTNDSLDALPWVAFPPNARNAPLSQTTTLPPAFVLDQVVAMRHTYLSPYVPDRRVLDQPSLCRNRKKPGLCPLSRTLYACCC